jgi:pimeloyl-ACP methyl ester carboxylesterase
MTRQPLLLLPGMLGSAALWDGVCARVGDIALPWPARIDLDDSVPAMAASVLARAPSTFALAGHSLGAIVALEVQRQAPRRVTHLILLNASARGANAAQQAAWSDWARRTENGEFDVVSGELARSNLPTSRRGDAALVDLSGAMARAVGADGFLRQLRAQSTRPDSLARLAEVTVPVTVISGDEDEVCPPPLQRELAAGAPTSELVSLRGGHMLPMENPDDVSAELRRVLLTTA